jgi:hypothetical protein
MIRRWHIKEILIGFLVMLLSVIIGAIILLVVLMRSNREIDVGPVYLLVPILSFTTGYYWSWRRSARPNAPPKPPSNVTIILKSTAVGIAAMVLSVIAYVLWVWMRIPRNVGVGVDFVSVGIRPLFWLVFLTIFLSGFLLEYRRGSKRRSMLTGGMAQ